MKFDSKVVLITGATSGMGEGMAHLFSQEGARVVLVGRSEEKASKIISKLKGDSLFIQADVSVASEVEKIVNVTIDKFGKIDCIVANAGILGIGNVVDLSLEDWHQTINTNLNQVFYLAKYGMPHLSQQEGATFVINASIAAFKSFPNHPAYCASKGALVPLTRSLAIDHAKDGVRVNCICPGPVDTPLIWDSAKAFENPEIVVQEVGASTLVGRLGTPLDVAKAALFLASDDSSWMTGSALTLDGGVMKGG